MNISKVITSGFEAYKAKLGLKDKDLIISKADSNVGFKNNNRLFWLFAYFDGDGPSPDKVIAEFNSRYKLNQKNKSESGGYVFVLPESDF